MSDEAHGQFLMVLTDTGDVSISLLGKTYDEFPPVLNFSCILIKRIDLGYGDGLRQLLLPKFQMA